VELTIIGKCGAILRTLVCMLIVNAAITIIVLVHFVMKMGLGILNNMKLLYITIALIVEQKRDII